MTPAASRIQTSKIIAGPGDTLANAVRRYLGDAIIQGRYEPGSRIEENTLALELGVSRTPVREALRQLEAAGLVAIRPNAGAVVVAISVDRLPVLFEALVELESLCARLAAARVNLAERLQLRALIDTSAAAMTADDPEAFARANRAFHEIIVAGARNADIQSAVTQLRMKAAPFRKAQFQARARVQALHNAHLAVSAAIEKSDPEAASSAMRHCVEGEMAAVLGQFTLPRDI